MHSTSVCKVNEKDTLHYLVLKDLDNVHKQEYLKGSSFTLRLFMRQEIPLTIIA